MPRDPSGTSGPAAPEAADLPASLGGWVWDLRADTVRVGAAAAELFGIPPEIGRFGVPAALLRGRTHLEDRAVVEGLIATAAAEGCSYVAEYRVRVRDEPPRWVLERGCFDVAEAGAPVRGRGFVLDVTPTGLAEAAYVRDRIVEASPPLVRAAGHAIAAHRDLTEAREPHLQRTSELLLLRIGRALARFGGR
ncbi:hypothetical protein [Methylobacterium sp. A54F]